MTFLNPERDPSGAGYQVLQSKIAVGSGGLFGKGYFGKGGLFRNLKAAFMKQYKSIFGKGA